MPGASTTPELAELLQTVFGHSGFRPHQQQVCEAAAAGRDVLLVMPTGAGKSLCYQLPALARGGTALVISPLIALMDDQAAKLSALGLRVARIHSGLPREDSRQACRDYLAGALDFLFIAPERMRVPGFPEMLAKRKPALVAIDEAHCISQWGHDFRPDYRTLGQHLPALRPSPIIALTATATPTVQRDIARQLDLQDPGIFITGFRRSNLAIEVVELSKPQRADFALKLLTSPEARPAIIYAQSRKEAEELAGKLHKHFPSAAYHAGLDPGTRDRVQRAFLSGKLDAVVATVAFGMGVDKADVRTVVHVALPGSVESFYQEIGRAGRDGLPSRTVLLHGFADRRLQEFFLEKNYPPLPELESVAAALPDDFTPVDVLHNTLRQKRNMIDRETLDRTIEKLLAAGVALMDMAGNVKGTGEAKWQKGYEAQIAARRAQIDGMIAFAESSSCRMAALVAHFGDTSDKATTCGLCDICNPSAGGAANAAHQPSNEERRHLRAILKALEGRGQSTGKLFTDLALMKDRKDFDALLEGLTRAGLVTIANDTFRSQEGRDITYRKATITHEGRSPDDTTLDTVWIRGSAAALPSTRGPARTRKTSRVAPKVSSSAVDALEQQLRAWRTEQAKAAGAPAFTVMHDRTLRAIAEAAPQNVAELAGVAGMGPSKLDRFGVAILTVCRGKIATSALPADGASTTSAQPSINPLTHGASPRSSVTASPPEHQRRGSYQPGAKPQGTAPIGAPRAEGPAHHGPAPSRPSLIPNGAIPAELTEAQSALDTRLREWRRETAKQAGLPSFFIFSDTVLRNIAAAGPQSVAELRTVRGLGPEKLEAFGPAVVNVCRMEGHTP